MWRVVPPSASSDRVVFMALRDPSSTSWSSVMKKTRLLVPAFGRAAGGCEYCLAMRGGAGVSGVGF